MATPDAITVTQLIRLVGTPDAPVPVDVRVDNDYASDPRMLPASLRRDYRTVSSWAGSMPAAPSWWSASAGRNWRRAPRAGYAIRACAPNTWKGN